MAGNFFRGTTAEQDPRWGKTDQKVMAQMEKAGSFDDILNQKVDMKKINEDVIFKWVTEKLTDLLGFEDDIVINLVINLLQKEKVDPRRMQMEVTGFLEKKTGGFMSELWTLLVDAQEQPSGIPSAFIKQKAAEIKKRQERVQGRSRPSRFSDSKDNGAELAASEKEKNHERHESRNRGRDRSRERERRVDENWSRHNRRERSRSRERRGDKSRRRSQHARSSSRSRSRNNSYRRRRSSSRSRSNDRANSRSRYRNDSSGNRKNE